MTNETGYCLECEHFVEIINGKLCSHSGGGQDVCPGSGANPTLADKILHKIDEELMDMIFEEALKIGYKETQSYKVCS